MHPLKNVLKDHYRNKGFIDAVKYHLKKFINNKMYINELADVIC